MRLIDADKISESKFHPLPYTHITPTDVNAESYKRGWNDAIDAIIADAPTVEEPQWIPCSEKLPEEGREVLACLTDWKTGEQRRVVSYRIDFNMWHGYGRYNEKCVAWMPLPELWRGDEE